MKVGTKSLLFGTHQFIIHPIMVLYSWAKLYGIPWDPRIWVAAIIHDWGYWGRPNMDGIEGKQHPYLGADLMGLMFGRDWFWFTLLHSKYMWKWYDKEPSKLYFADKMVLPNTPKWFYLFWARLTGELKEYMQGKYDSESEWFDATAKRLTEIVNEGRSKNKN